MSEMPACVPLAFIVFLFMSAGLFCSVCALIEYGDKYEIPPVVHFLIGVWGVLWFISGLVCLVLMVAADKYAHMLLRHLL